MIANHVQVIVRLDRSVAMDWSDLAVARRWLSVYPRKYLSDGTPILPSEPEIVSAAKDPAQIGKWRLRLANLGWFMKAYKEPIARRANREDDCTGGFGEGWFHSVPQLDQAALIACMASIDLNPIRAKVADRPERSRHTSGFRRIRALNRHAAAAKIRTHQPKKGKELLAKAGLSTAATHAEDGLWLTPRARCHVGVTLANQTITVDEYLTVLDATGRLLKAGKRGAIPPELAPIRRRLDLSLDAWLATMLGWRMFAFTSALGHAATRTAEATKRWLRLIRNRCPLFAQPVDACAVA